MMTETCGTCHSSLVKQNVWINLTPAQRATATNEGCRRKAAHGICSRCYEREGRSPEGRAARNEAARVKAERLEDLCWMADVGGECLDGAAQRLNLTVRAVELFLQRAGEREVLRKLTARNPRDHNRTPDGSSITRAMPEAYVDRKNAKRNERRRTQGRERAAA